ncbi:MAG: hypothetical protein DCC43_07675 [Candidatus Brocadia sp.]|nr:hypothetical protein [Candidatus Brocadia fulgida]MCC6326228.1 hypothetical protein [Candidatus Brocadia sp.]MCE7910900.1 hypothetical protein [Candidatus Brocadia sp. AMX3]MDG5996964.1 hypothetical protein [Candidatus Brocadia sp.]RIK00094.1 MAG: hypothetical protein DCC43_07675 [Candidatus Brocadia sp.]
MLRTISVQDPRWVAKLQKEARQLLTSLGETISSHKSFLLKSAVIFMAVKIGIILLATVSTVVFLLNTATPYLTVEMSKTQAMLFAFPLTLIMMFKVYFIGKILMTHDTSKCVIQSVVHGILLKGKQCVRRIGETVPAGLSPFSLSRVRDR